MINSTQLSQINIYTSNKTQILPFNAWLLYEALLFLNGMLETKSLFLTRHLQRFQHNYDILVYKTLVAIARMTACGTSKHHSVRNINTAGIHIVPSLNVLIVYVSYLNRNKMIPDKILIVTIV